MKLSEEHPEHLRMQRLSRDDGIFAYRSSLHTSNFEGLLLESVDRTLADLLGRRSRDQIYDHLATQYRYGREEIPFKIYEFYEFLEKVFGSSAKTVGRTIIRRLSVKLGYEFFNVPGFEFVDYLDALRTRAERDVNRANEDALQETRGIPRKKQA